MNDKLAKWSVITDYVIILVLSLLYQQDHDGLQIKSKVDRMITGESIFFSKNLCRNNPIQELVLTFPQ